MNSDSHLSSQALKNLKKVFFMGSAIEKIFYKFKPSFHSTRCTIASGYRNDPTPPISSDRMLSVVRDPGLGSTCHGPF